MNKGSLKKSRIFPAVLLFLLIFVSGLVVYDDYGISEDEPLQRNHALVSYRWINRTLFHREIPLSGGTEDLERYPGRYYGVAVQLPLTAAEDIYRTVTQQEMPVRTIYHIRHLYTRFFFVLSLFCFYKLLDDLFRSSLLSTAGVLMIFTFGRFFAESFYNIKDMIFTALFTICLFLAERVIRSGYSKKWGLLFSIGTAFLVSSRIIGALLPLGLLIFALYDRFIARKNISIGFFAVLFSAYLFWLLITPASWTDPLRFSLDYIQKFSDYTDWTNYFLYDGQWHAAGQTPRDYYLRWIGMTVPLVYLLFSILGGIAFSASLFSKSSGREHPRTASLLLAGSVILFTLLYQIIKTPTVYNAWRHCFFLYPLMILFAVYGAHRLFMMRSAVIRYGAMMLLGLSLAYNTFLLVKNHPAQFTAYNPLGEKVSSQYDADYWGMSLYPQMQWILENNSGTKTLAIRSNGDEKWRVELHHAMLPENQQSRLEIVEDDADYILYWRLSPVDFTRPGEEPFSIEGYEEVHPMIRYGTFISSLYRKTK